MPTSKRSALRRLTAAIALARLNNTYADDPPESAAAAQRLRRDEERLLREITKHKLETVEYMADVWESIAGGGHGIHDEALAGRKHLAIDFWGSIRKRGAVDDGKNQTRKGARNAKKRSRQR